MKPSALLHPRLWTARGLAAVALGSLLAAGCGVPAAIGSDDDRTGRYKTVQLEVEFYQQPCLDAAGSRSLCIVVRELLPGDPQWEIVPPFNNLQFEYGRTKHVEVVATEHRDDSGRSWWTYGGVTRVSSDVAAPPGESFVLRYDRREYVDQRDPDNPKAYGAPPFGCADGQDWLCAGDLQKQLGDLAMGGVGFEATFVTGLPGQPATLVSVRQLY